MKFDSIGINRVFVDILFERGIRLLGYTYVCIIKFFKGNLCF